MTRVPFPESLAASPHWVYRCYAEDGRLLYVGCTSQLSHRIRAHRSEKHWFRDVALVTDEMYPNRDVARAAELEAIRSENPRYNRVGRIWPQRSAVSA